MDDIWSDCDRDVSIIQDNRTDNLYYMLVKIRQRDKRKTT